MGKFYLALLIKQNL